jgi:predicted transcriptional regulator
MDMNESKSRKTRCHELTPLEKETLKTIFEAIMEFGQAPTVNELETRMSKPASSIISTLDKLEEKDLLLRKKGTQEITSIYPFSLTPTSHRVILEDGKQLFAMCAVDAVGMASMFDKDLKVISRCGWCKQEVTIQIKQGEIVSKSHPGILIWNFEPTEGPAAETCCPMVNFFCSKEHLTQWEDANPNIAKKACGDLLEQLHPDIKKRWKDYGVRVGVR